MGPLTVAKLTDLVTALGATPGSAGEAERIDRIRVLEQVKSACAAAQARETVALREQRLAAEEAARVPVRDRGKGLGAEVALARRESPHRGSRLLGLAQALVTEMPHTLAALERGEINEWRATLAVRETACLSRDDRRQVDVELAGRLGAWGDRQVEAETRKIAYRLDPHAVVARARQAEADRRVTLRPAPDTMSSLTGLLPLKQGVAAYAALRREADQLRSAGDPRSRGQIMADLLVERVTGLTTADDVTVEVQLIVSDQTLAGHDDQPAHVTGHGPVPAPWARTLVRDTAATVWLRKLYTDHHRLVALESTRRIFPEGLRRLLVARDQICRTPWCNAPIRHVDHVIPAQSGGPTSEANAQGLCEACNHAKQASGWHARPGPGDTINTTTPTGHRYTSRPPDPPGAAPPSLLERQLADLISAHAAKSDPRRGSAIGSPRDGDQQRHQRPRERWTEHSRRGR